MKQSSLIPVESLEKAIYLSRGEKVMLDRDLAALYGVPTKVFNQAVKRHRERFPGTGTICSQANRRSLIVVEQRRSQGQPTSTLGEGISRNV